MKINKTERKALMQNENYQKYDEKKQKLKNKYPQEVFELEPIGRPKLEYIRYSERERKLHKDYLKKVADLLFEPSGDYQKFSWDIISDVDKLAMERKARGRKEYKYE